MASTLGRNLEDTADADQQYAWRKRALEEATAIGGLRNPSANVKMLKGAASVEAELIKVVHRSGPEQDHTCGDDWRPSQ